MSSIYSRWLAPFVILAACAAPSFAESPRVGFDQAWLVGKFGADLTSGFDEAEWRRVLERTHTAGGSILRVWLFEGEPGQGIVWDEGDAHRPAGVEPRLLENVKRLAALAAEAHVQIYWTLRDGNWPGYWDKSKKQDLERAWNIDNDKYDFGTLFDKNVVGPVLDAIRERPEAVYALDVLNEAEGMVAGRSWPDGWEGARRYIAREVAFVHGHAPGIKVSASAGWGSAADDILEGRFDGLGLDLLDVHVYTDGTEIPKGRELVAHAREQAVPIIVGEFGQASKKVDHPLQAKVVRGILDDAARLGFTAVLAWQLEDSEERFRFYDGDEPRQAVGEVIEFTRAHPTTDPFAAAESKGLAGALEGTTDH